VQIQYLIEKGEKWLEEYKHWYPYRLPYMPDGSAYQRNLEVPQDLCEDDRLVDVEAEIKLEFDNPHSDIMRNTWRSNF